MISPQTQLQVVLGYWERWLAGHDGASEVIQAPWIWPHGWAGIWIYLGWRGAQDSGTMAVEIGDCQIGNHQLMSQFSVKWNLLALVWAACKVLAPD